jgi:hypothetical protein
LKNIGVKKRRGIMPQKEGKSVYNLNGYVALCDYLNRMIPVEHQDGSIFAQLFTNLSVNTIGRSDNIKDLLAKNVGWGNDSFRFFF